MPGSKELLPLLLHNRAGKGEWPGKEQESKCQSFKSFICKIQWVTPVIWPRWEGYLNKSLSQDKMGENHFLYGSTLRGVVLTVHHSEIGLRKGLPKAPAPPLSSRAAPPLPQAPKKGTARGATTPHGAFCSPNTVRTPPWKPWVVLCPQKPRVVSQHRAEPGVLHKKPLDTAERCSAPAQPFHSVTSGTAAVPALLPSVPPAEPAGHCPSQRVCVPLWLLPTAVHTHSFLCRARTLPCPAAPAHQPASWPMENDNSEPSWTCLLFVMTWRGPGGQGAQPGLLAAFCAKVPKRTPWMCLGWALQTPAGPGRFCWQVCGCKSNQSVPGAIPSTRQCSQNCWAAPLCSYPHGHV